MPTSHIINDCFVHRSIKSLFIKSPFAFSKIPSHSSRLRRWHRLAELPLCFSFSFFFLLFTSVGSLFSLFLAFLFFFSFHFHSEQDEEGSQRGGSMRNVRKASQRQRKDVWELISLNVRTTEASAAWLFIF